MADELLLDVSPLETRAALLSGGLLTELVVERRGEESLLGRVYLARVRRVEPALNAAFLDCGLPQPALLRAADARLVRGGATPAGRGSGIAALVHEGEALVVQVSRDAQAGKGVRVTGDVTIPGWRLAYAPLRRAPAFSRRLTDAAERERLSRLATGLGTEGGAFVFRSRAAGAAEEELVAEALALRRLWTGIVERARGAVPPVCLFDGFGPLGRLVLARGVEPTRVVIDGRPTFLAARRFLEELAPPLAARLELHDGPDDLFAARDVEDQIQAALGREVELPSGGRVVIEETTALTAIDVDAGAALGRGAAAGGALAVNLKAARVIARQLRLRGIGGTIVVDFISLRDAPLRRRVADTLREALADDPTPTQIHPMPGPGGLVALVRPRPRQTLREALLEPCPRCEGSGWVKCPATVAADLLRALARRAPGGAAPAGREVRVDVAPGVADFLDREGRPAVAEVEAKRALRVALRRDPALPRDRFVIVG